MADPTWPPRLRMTFDGLKGAIDFCLHDWQVKNSEIIRQAVERFCTPENIQAAVDEEVRETVDAAVREEIRTFFKYSGAGRKAIRDAIMAKLEASIKEDEVMGRIYREEPLK